MISSQKTWRSYVVPKCSIHSEWPSAMGLVRVVNRCLREETSLLSLRYPCRTFITCTNTSRFAGHLPGTLGTSRAPRVAALRCFLIWTQVKRMVATIGIARTVAPNTTRFGIRMPKWLSRMNRTAAVTRHGRSKDVKARLRKITPGVRGAIAESGRTWVREQLRFSACKWFHSWVPLKYQITTTM